ncbi:hypothetical protein [Roseivivax sediminis]|uniref:hypothetical protein n=1 Tax=Roseivivax sediminis TaxID=936889 RepID=UPI00122D0872|nr:hypothetical protein [Roseivivax sediminis]
MSISDWPNTENEAVVASYFTMLSDELLGCKYNKAARNRVLQDQPGRRRGSTGWCLWGPYVPAPRRDEAPGSGISAVEQSDSARFQPGVHGINFLLLLSDDVVVDSRPRRQLKPIGPNSAPFRGCL